MFSQYHGVILSLIILLSCVAARPRVDVTQHFLQPADAELTTKSSSPPLQSLEDIRIQYSLPALAALYSKDGLPSEMNVTGYRMALSTVEAEIGDQWHLGSLTKAMTATLLALLIKQGLFTWDTTLETLLPNLAIHPAHRDTPLAMLTSHRAGLSVDIENDFFARLYDESLSGRDGRWLFVEKALLAPPALSKGTYSYENTDYIIAGSIVDLYSGMVWEDFIQQRLWEPLNMKNCGFGPSDESSNFSLDNPWPHGIVLIGDYRKAVPLTVPFKYRDNPRPYSSAGTVHCPIAEYSKFLRLHADACSGKPNALNLTKADFAALHTPRWVDGDELAAYTPGGWGRDVKSLDGGPYMLSHAGSNAYNYAAVRVVVPESGSGDVYVATTNVALEEGIGAILHEMYEYP